MAVPNGGSEHRVVITAPKGAWRKQLIVSGGVALGVSIAAGCNDGVVAKFPNTHLKYDAVGLGVAGECNVTLQFLKAKTFAIMCNYDTNTFTLPDEATDLIFFWPEDAPGE